MSPQRVILFVLDGLRPDGLQQASTPCVDRLITPGRLHLDGPLP